MNKLGEIYEQTENTGCFVDLSILHSRMKTEKKSDFHGEPKESDFENYCLRAV